MAKHTIAEFSEFDWNFDLTESEAHNNAQVWSGHSPDMVFVVQDAAGTIEAVYINSVRYGAIAQPADGAREEE